MKTRKILANDFFKTVTDNSILAILVLNKNGNLVYINQVARDVLELDADQDTHQFNIKAYFPSDGKDSRLRTLNHSLLKYEGLIQDVLIKKKNGQNFIANIGMRFVHHKKKKYQILMLQDVTMQKKMQREIAEKQLTITKTYQDLLEQNKKLLEHDQAKNRFMAITTHELRTPLSAMFSAAEILKMKLYDDAQQMNEFINIIFDQGQHLLNLVNDILDFAKLQSDKMDYYVSEQSITDLLLNEVQALRAMADSAKVQLTIMPQAEGIFCYFDEVRLRQVLTNLINNAIKYNRPEGKVTVTYTQDEKRVYVHIKDTGRGIRIEDQNKIFNEFETLGKISNHAKGTGLGLAISQKMIRSMGGEIRLHSELNVGSTFTVEIPKTRVLSDEFYRRRQANDDSSEIAA